MAQAAYEKLITSQKLKKIKKITDQDIIRPKCFAPVRSQAFRSLILVTPKVGKVVLLNLVMFFSRLVGGRLEVMPLK
jgi:hypothetical protein